MEKRIELEKRGRAAEEIKELNLDNCRATQITGLTEAFTNLESLSLINVGLTTLKGFPKLPNLTKLELSDNRISSGLNLLQGCANLQYLNLSGNKLKDIETLEPLKDFKDLKNLDLFNCEVTNIENYREKVFELLETLQFLDGYDRNNVEADGDEDEDEDEDGEDSDEDDDDEDGDGDDVVDVDEDDDDDDDDEDGEDDDEGEVGLSYLEKENLEEESEGEEFEGGAGEDEEDEEIDEEDAESGDDEQRGVKRKHEEDGEGDGAE
ncbi:hypothetical protein NP493_307g02033 [Ridgeia piscesae]|uniref:Acidic leucine-rich nuclear phosphoprotein 32 family member A n=1 Tax=Ridgeia piscesae TaxID=27915 RepID=A0AAD9NV47_RIDPI|nr:hypothetical protein NP493_307g02033 [Ridgeia piscesae]